MTDPKQSIVYLDALQSAGFTDDHFCQVHHYRKQGRRDTIVSHRNYCKRISTFLPDGTNERVQRRLAFILENFRAPGNTRTLMELCEEAYATI